MTQAFPSEPSPEQKMWQNIPRQPYGAYVEVEQDMVSPKMLQAGTRQDESC